MGAIGDDHQAIMARNHAKLKSASVEAANFIRPTIRCSSINIYEHEDSNEDDGDRSLASTSRDDLSETSCSPVSPVSFGSYNQHHSHAEYNHHGHGHGHSHSRPSNATTILSKNLLSIATGSSYPILKPSASTSCLYTASQAADLDAVSLASDGSPQQSERSTSSAGVGVGAGSDHKGGGSGGGGGGGGGADTCSSSSTLVCIPTRASLTHEWRKLKTPNKCRECNLLVYFNGRECSFCGFVAHKKCVTILVIKCSGQQLATAAASHRKSANKKHGGGANNNTNLKNDNNKNAKLLAATIQQQSQQQQQQQQQQQAAVSRLASQFQLSFRRNPKVPPIRPIFGQPIQVHDHQLIDFVRRFIYEIDTRGLTAKGIYRVSSIKSKVDKLCNYYDQNQANLVDLSSFHPNIIANALKMYLRQLPEPLMTNKLYEQFIDIAKKYNQSSSSSLSNNNTDKQPTNNSNSSSLSLPVVEVPRSNHHNAPVKPRRSISHQATSGSTAAACHLPDYNPALIADFKEICDQLPPINREMVAIIMRHLRRVADMSEENQMSAKNLSIIFGPTLLSSDNKSLAIVDNVHQARVVELMITWANQIFPQYDNYESSAAIILAPGVAPPPAPPPVAPPPPPLAPS